jgi:c-di-GMP-binding flagellar brake protein YcgR
VNPHRASDTSIGTAAQAVRARSFADRQPIDLDAQYRVQGPPLWLRCRVVDISMHGAGLLLVDEVTDPMRTVVIELRPPGSTDRIVLNAEIRHSSVTDGQRRIGVEFLDMGTFDELALCELIARHAEVPEQPWQQPLPGMR